MNAARRGHKRRDWPRGLREPRPGYYTWDHPDGRSLVIGRVPLAVAKSEAIAANQHIANTRPGLVERLTGAGNTIAALLKKMPTPENKNTKRSLKSLDKRIAAGLGKILCADLTVQHCAELVSAVADEGKARGAEALRSRLIAVCKKGRAMGWLDFDPASITERPKVTVKRGRLTLATFLAIYEKAPEVSEWLQHAMALALVTGADRSTIAQLKRADVVGDCLTFTRGKTDTRIAIPLALTMQATGWRLEDLVRKRSGVVSPLLLHHVSPWGNAPAGSAVHPDRISRSFTEARTLAGIDDKAAPTFHEIRSLAKRLYNEQGNVDTKALLGHATERMSDMYADPRGVEAVRVRIG